MAVKVYNNVAKALKSNVRTFSGIIPKFVEVTGKKLIGGFFGPLIRIGLMMKIMEILKKIGTNLK